MKSRNEMYGDIVSQMTGTYLRKNSDYGGSFTKLYEEFGAVSPAIKLTDKLERFKSLMITGNIQQVNDEAVTDTLMDMANYAIMTIIEFWQRQQQLEKAGYKKEFDALQELAEGLSEEVKDED